MIKVNFIVALFVWLKQIYVQLCLTKNFRFDQAVTIVVIITIIIIMFLTNYFLILSGSSLFIYIFPIKYLMWYD